MNRNSDTYKREAAKAIGTTFLTVLLRLERIPERSLTVEQRRLKRRLQTLKR